MREILTMFAVSVLACGCWSGLETVLRGLNARNVKSQTKERTTSPPKDRRS